MPFCWKNRKAYQGFTALKMSGIVSREAMPEKARAPNQTSMTGPKAPAMRSAPRDCATKRAMAMPEAIPISVA